MGSDADETLYGAYLDACEQGRVEPPDAFLAEHPGASDELRESLAAVYRTLRERDAAAEDVPFERLGDFRLLSPSTRAAWAASSSPSRSPSGASSR